MVARTYTVLPPIVDNWFQILFHSPSGVLFTFPSRYLCTIGHQRVFSLTRWSGQIPTEFHVLHGTWEIRNIISLFFSYKAVTFYGYPFQSYSNKKDMYILKVHFQTLILATTISQRMYALTWYDFRLFPFRSPLLRESLCFIFLTLLRCFSSRRSLFCSMNSNKNDLGYQVGFPHSEIFGSLSDWRFPEAFGSLPPPSSSFDAKASTKCPFQLTTNLL